MSQTNCPICRIVAGELPSAGGPQHLQPRAAGNGPLTIGAGAPAALAQRIRAGLQE